MMSRVTAMEYVKKGVRVNTIVPGAMQTPMQANVTAEADAWQRSKIHMGDLGEPEDISYGATYLLSDEDKHVTVAELVVDGGWSVSARPTCSAVRSLNAVQGGGWRAAAPSLRSHATTAEHQPLISFTSPDQCP